MKFHNLTFQGVTSYKAEYDIENKTSMSRNMWDGIQYIRTCKERAEIEWK